MPSISAPAFVIVLGEMALSRANLLLSYLGMRNGAVHVDVNVKILLGYNADQNHGAVIIMYFKYE
jgi:hypothetical protein